MAPYIDNLPISNYEFKAKENPFANEWTNSSHINYVPMVTSNSDTFSCNSDSFVLQNSGDFIIGEYSPFNLNTATSQTFTLNGWGWLDDLKFKFDGIKELFRPATKSNASLLALQKSVDRKPITVEGIDYSIMGNDASRIKLLRPDMQRKVYEMFKYAKEKGWKIYISSTYRSTREQAYLYNEWINGRYNVPIVAKPGTSRHEFGCAIDFYVNGGTGSEQQELGRYATQTLGLRWGQNWSKNKEAWHFDLDPAETADS